jgi:hypothetical protein
LQSPLWQSPRQIGFRPRQLIVQLPSAQSNEHEAPSSQPHEPDLHWAVHSVPGPHSAPQLPVQVRLHEHGLWQKQNPLSHASVQHPPGSQVMQSPPQLPPNPPTPALDDEAAAPPLPPLAAPAALELLAPAPPPPAGTPPVPVGPAPPE